MNEVTATQAAAITGLSERTIRRKIASGQIPARRLAPNRFAIHVQDLPSRRGVDIETLVAQVEALEQRITRLEMLVGRTQQPHQLEDEAVSGPAAIDVSVMPLRELVAQLTREVQRLSPLLTRADHTQIAHGADQVKANQRKGSRSRNLHALAHAKDERHQSIGRDRQGAG